MIAFIPTKGRQQTETYKLFEISGFKVFHFIEPQEIDSYDVPNPVNIGQNDKGITYVRNFMLDFARQQDIQFCVICDDDITQFGRVYKQKAMKGHGAQDIVTPFEVFQNSGAALAGMNQRQFAWSEKKNIKINNGKTNGCIFLNIKRVGWRYRDNTKEDLDFTMQCLDHRQNFLCFARRFFSTPAIGTNVGGLHNHYTAKRDAEWAQAMKRDWPEYTKIIEQYGRIDVRVDYKRKAKDMGLKVQ